MSDSFDDDDDACSILVPVDVVGTPGVIKSITAGGSELPEDPAAVPWGFATNYVARDRVHFDHKIYEANRASFNKNPSEPVNQFNADGTPSDWIYVGPTNRTAMFDGLISSQTVAASPLVIKLAPGAFNGFALFALEADSYSVEVKSASDGDVIYSETDVPLDASTVADYYEYFFDPFKPLTQFSRYNIEPYGASEITLTLNKASGSVKVGMFAIGDLRPMGIPQRDATVSPGTFTYFKQDAYGNATIKKRANATSMSISAVLEIDQANIVKATIDEISATPVVVVGSRAMLYEWMTVFGLVTADISPVPYPYCTIKMSVKGFI